MGGCYSCVRNASSSPSLLNGNKVVNIGVNNNINPNVALNAALLKDLFKEDAYFYLMATLNEPLKDGVIIERIGLHFYPSMETIFRTRHPSSKQYDDKRNNQTSINNNISRSNSRSSNSNSSSSKDKIKDESKSKVKTNKDQNKGDLKKLKSAKKSNNSSTSVNLSLYDTGYDDKLSTLAIYAITSSRSLYVDRFYKIYLSKILSQSFNNNNPSINIIGNNKPIDYHEYHDNNTNLDYYSHTVEITGQDMAKIIANFLWDYKDKNIEVYDAFNLNVNAKEISYLEQRHRAQEQKLNRIKAIKIDRLIEQCLNNLGVNMT